MLRKECDCGRVLYEDVRYCPSCGRRLVEKDTTLNPVTSMDEMNEEKST